MEVRLNSIVTNVTPRGVSIGDEFIPVRNVFWAAGVKANALGRSIGVPLDRAGPVVVGPNLTIPDHPEVFVVGDLAKAKSADTNKPVSGLAQAAIQMGRYAGRTIASETTGQSVLAAKRPFIYRDKGSMAIIGKAKAVAQTSARSLPGCCGAAYTHSVPHRLSQPPFGPAEFARDPRLITGDSRLDIQVPRPPDFVRRRPSSGKGESREAG